MPTDSWFGRFRHLHTEAEQKTDRVFTYNASAPLAGYLGDAPNRNQWVNLQAVSYEGLRGEDFAALVWDAGDDRLRVALFNFRNEPLTGRMRVWRLDHGWYRVRVGPDADDDGAMEAPYQEHLVELRRHDPIEIVLPPRQVTVVQADLVQGLDDIRGRADLAVSPIDTVLPGDGSAIVRVHNLGRKPVANLTVTLERNREPVSTQVIPALEAPVDLVPRHATVVFPAVQDGDVVVVDRADAIPEIAEHNNRIVLGTGPADTDGDGLPDWWELWHFQSATAADPAADDDLDGQNNRFEFAADTVPINPLSRLGIIAVDPVPPDRIRVTWSGGSNVVQYLYRGTPGGGSDPVWGGILTNPPPTGSTQFLLDHPPNWDGKPLFYRLKAGP